MWVYDGELNRYIYTCPWTTLFWTKVGGPFIHGFFFKSKCYSATQTLNLSWESWYSSVKSLSRFRLFTVPWTSAHQASLSITNSQSLLKLMSIALVMPSNHLILSIIPFSSCLQSFPASGTFPKSQFFASGGQSIGVSASTLPLPMNTQDWFLLGLTGLISLQSKGLSRVFFSNTTVQKHTGMRWVEGML